MAAPESNRPDWDRLFETAAGQSGYVTTSQAAEAGYSTHLLRKHIHAGRVTRPQRGMVGSPDDILARLQEAARRDLADFMTFEVGPDEDHPEIQNDGMQYDGLRFRACRAYAQPH